MIYIDGQGIDNLSHLRLTSLTLLEFAVRMVKSVLIPLSAIGRISVPTRWFIQVQLYRGS